MVIHCDVSVHSEHTVVILVVGVLMDGVPQILVLPTFMWLHLFCRPRLPFPWYTIEVVFGALATCLLLYF